METRRKEVGRQIKIHRRRANFSSQRAFAEAIGKSESSVANAERGSDRIGDGAVYEAIESKFDWPIGSITAYIAGQGKPPWILARRAETPTKPPAADDSWASQLLADDWTPAEITRVEAMSLDAIEDEARVIGRFSGEDARLRYLHDAAVIKLRQRAPVSEKPGTLGR